LSVIVVTVVELVAISATIYCVAVGVVTDLNVLSEKSNTI
jgi:hypothetical protein